MSFWSRNGWILLFCIAIFAMYFHFSGAKKKEIFLAKTCLQKMELQKKQALERKEDLQIQIVSQSDPAWVEMVLIDQLGVVPEGFLKVHFQK